MTGLDFEVLERTPYWFKGNALDSGAGPTVPVGRAQKVPGRKFLVHSGSGRVLGYMGTDYVVHQPRRIVEAFGLLFEEASGVKLERAGTFMGGAVVWGQAPLRGAGFTLPGGDKVEGFYHLTTSYNGASMTRGRVTPRAVSCYNSWVSATFGHAKAEVAFRHSAGFGRPEVGIMRAKLGLAAEEMGRLGEWASAASKVKVDEETTLRFVAQLINPKLLLESVVMGQQALMEQGLEERQAGVIESILLAEEALAGKSPLDQIREVVVKGKGKMILDAIISGAGQDQEDRRGTAWGLFNGVTNYANHSGRGGVEKAEARLYSTLHGERREMVARAENLVGRMIQ